MLHIKRNTYLSINYTNNGCFEPHSSYKANMKILVKNQGLKTGTNKQQRGIKVAMPVWGTFAVYKVEQQSVEREMSPLTDGKQNQMSQLQP